MLIKRKSVWFIVIVGFLSLAMHFSQFSKDLMGIHVWRQAQTQSTIINFYEEDMNILNPRRNERGNGDGIFRMEFPLMQWMVAAVYKVFGNHLVLTRISMFMVGLFTVAGMYKLLTAVFLNETLAFFGAWAFNFSPAFFYYTINPLPDNFALCCSVWGIAYFFTWYRNRKIWFLLFSGLFLSIGALCKLPFILYYIVPFIYFASELRKKGISKVMILNCVSLFGFVILPLAWYISVISKWKGNGIVQGVMDSKLPFLTITGYLWHNLVSTLPELLLNYGSVFFFIAAFWFIIRQKIYRKSLFPVFAIWGFAILGYFLFEINMIENVHDYYLFPFYPVLFILVGYGAWNIYNLKTKPAVYFTAFCIIILPFSAWLRMNNRWDPDNPGFNKDLLIYKNELRAAVPENALCVVGNDISHFIFLYYVNKKGWVFDSDHFTEAQLNEKIASGATYLYTDSHVPENDLEMKAHLDKPIMEKGSIRIYRLK